MVSTQEGEAMQIDVHHAAIPSRTPDRRRTFFNLYSQVIDLLFSNFSSLLTHANPGIVFCEGSNLAIRLSDGLSSILNIIWKREVENQSHNSRHRKT
jgi:hypothetical protein